MSRTHLVPMVLLAALWALPAMGAETAEQIITKAGASRDAGNSIQTIKLIKTDKRGTIDTQVLETHTRISDDLVASRATLQSPEFMAGFTLLTVEASSSETGTWIYMPAGKSLLQITGTGRQGPFLATHFTYEDLDIGDAGVGTHELLADQTITVAGQSYDCYQISTVPNAGIETAYGKLVTWIEKNSYVPRQIEFYGKDGSTMVKRLTIEKVSVEGDVQLPTRMKMDDLKNGGNTVMEVSGYRLGVELDELPAALFDPEALSSE